jgi:hypothetical protein
LAGGLYGEGVLWNRSERSTTRYTWLYVDLLKTKENVLGHTGTGVRTTESTLPYFTTATYLQRNNRIVTVPIARVKGAKGKCDVLASKITRSVGKCKRCNSTEWLQTSHIISRRYAATRTNLENLECLCAKCHRFFTDHPVEFTKWIFSSNSIGEAKYEELRKLSLAYTKMDWDEELTRLKEIAKELGL